MKMLTLLLLALGTALLFSSCASKGTATNRSDAAAVSNATVESAPKRKSQPRYVYDTQKRTYVWVDDDLTVTSPYQN